MKTTLQIMFGALVLFAGVHQIRAQGTAFIYQGQLINDGSPANGLYDFQFSLFDAPSGGAQVGSTATNLALGVTNGLFTTNLDFGDVFTGNPVWLAISVRSNSTGSYTDLTPLQPLTPVPCAIFANTASNLSGTVASANVSGLYAKAVTLSNAANQFSGTFSGNGTNLTSLNANNLTLGTVPLSRLSGITSNQLDSATWQLATNLNGGFAALAGNVVSGIALTNAFLTNAFITNSVFAGNGGGLTNLNASQLSSGVIPLARLPDTVATNLNGGFAALASNVVSGIALTNAFLTNALITNSVFAGNGGGLTNLNASQLSSGVIPLARLPDTVVTNLNGGYAALASNVVSGIALTNAFLTNALITNSIFAGNGGGLTNLNASQLSSIGNADGGIDNFFAGPSGNPITTGSNNTADGVNALVQNTRGSGNTAIGNNALAHNTNGSYNTAEGVSALSANTNGSNNIALGYQAGIAITGSSNIDIGNPGIAGDINTIRIGASQTSTYLTGNVYLDGVAVSSDRDAKENFSPVNYRAVLDKVASLPVTEWNYKKNSKAVRHIGPMAQDFQAAFELNGADDKHISVVDESGVALAAIQGLNQKLEETRQAAKAKDGEIQSLKQQNDLLAKRLNELEATVKSLAEGK